MTYRLAFAELLLLWASFGAFSNARPLDNLQRGSSSVETAASLRHMLASGYDSCSEIKDNIDLYSIETLNKGYEEITASAADCCKLCNEHPDCKSWTRIKSASLYNRVGECYLRDHVPEGRKCFSCESGVAKPVEDEVNAKLAACVADGEASARIAVIGACSVLTRKCPVKKIALTIRTISPESKQDRALERTCDILFEDACIRAGFKIAEARDDDCASILTVGPEDSVDVPECPDYQTAIGIFKSTLQRACVG